MQKKLPLQLHIEAWIHVPKEQFVVEMGLRPDTTG